MKDSSIDIGEEEGSAITRRRVLATTALGGVAAVGGLAAAGASLSGITGARWESASSATSQLTTGPTVGVRQVAEGIQSPTSFEAPERGPVRAYVADKIGPVYVLDSDGLRESPFLDLTEHLADFASWEQGVLGLALHPDFHRNGRCYVRYSAPPGDDTPDGFSHRFRLSEFRATPDGLHADVESERILLEIPQPHPNHNAGAIKFGPDGHLYVAVGDGGHRDDRGVGHAEDWYAANRGGNGQDVTENLLGSILRIDVDDPADGRAYGIPEDNPLVGREGADEHYAWGFRNPWGMSFHGPDLYVADVGQDHREEVNRVSKGGNYGWNVREGSRCVDNRDSRPGLSRMFTWGYYENLFTEFSSMCPATTSGGEPLRDPVAVYPHMRDGNAVGDAVIGGYVYENDTIPALQGKYVFGDIQAEQSGRLFATAPPDRTSVPGYSGGTTAAGTDETAATRDGTGTGTSGFWPIEELTVAGTDSGRLGQLVYSFGRDREGELYVLTNGAIFKLVPA